MICQLLSDKLSDLNNGIKQFDLKIIQLTRIKNESFNKKLIRILKENFCLLYGLTHLKFVHLKPFI